MSDWKQPLRLVEQLDADGNIEDKGVAKLIDAVDEARGLAENLKCDELLAFATSAVRSATNSEAVLKKVEKKTGVKLKVISGEEEARSTFQAVRRWYGWSAGRITNLDIGGGSLELSTGSEEVPDLAVSLDLGAGRLTHEWFDTDPAGAQEDQCAARLHRRGARGPGRKIPRAGGGRPGRRYVEDVPLAGAPDRCGAVVSRPIRAAHAHRAWPAPADCLHLAHDGGRPR